MVARPPAGVNGFQRSRRLAPGGTCGSSHARVLPWRTRGRTSEVVDGQRRQRWYLPPTLLLLSLASMLLLHRLWPLGRWLAPPWTWLGLLPLVFGIGLVLYVARLFSLRGTTIKPFEESSALLTEGPYRASRNPIYAGMLLALVAPDAGCRTPRRTSDSSSWRTRSQGVDE